MPDRLPDLAAELVRLPVDVLVAGSKLEIAAAKQATSVIPIVTVIAADPVRNGFIQSFARPGGNVTGLTNDPGQAVHGKLLELLKEMLPRISTVGVLVQQGVGYERAAVEVAASRLGLRLYINDTVRASDEVEDAFAALVRERVDAYYMVGGPVLFVRRQRIAELALANRLPGVHWAREWVDAGGLVSYGTSVADVFRRVATYVDRILKGAKPGELAVEQPSRFYLVINGKTAKALGITIPPGVLLRADDVIE